MAQQPLSPEDKTIKLIPQMMAYPGIHIRARVRVLEEKMATENFKLKRWVKRARKKGIRYFEPPVNLEPSPIESINCAVMPLRALAPMPLDQWSIR
jgi:hypothetical protein